jgi:four helix bundle protein
VGDFRELKVWQKAHRLTLAVYQCSTGFPVEERFGLTSQLRRCAASVAANLAEGCGRNGDPEFARFCSIALGSASELDYHLLLARDLDLLKSAQYTALAKSTNEIKRMLSSLIRTLKAS